MPLIAQSTAACSVILAVRHFRIAIASGISAGDNSKKRPIRAFEGDRPHRSGFELLSVAENPSARFHRLPYLFIADVARSVLWCVCPCGGKAPEFSANPSLLGCRGSWQRCGAIHEV
jgi:hypothetical protein